MTATVPPPLRRPFAGLVLAALVCAAFLAALAWAPPAAAHATLTESDPAQGSVVARAPDAVTLTFTEDVAVSDDAVRVLDPRGERVDEGRAKQPESGTVSVALRPGIADGTYTVTWQAVSADSHPIAGAYTFSVGAPSETTVALPGQVVGGGTVGLLYDVARYTAYAGFTLLIGGTAFVLVCWREGASVRPVRRVVVTGWVTLFVATLALLLLRSPYATGGTVADALDLGGMREVLETKTGSALVSRLVLLGAAALFVTVLFGTFTRPRPAAQRRDLLFGLCLGGGVVAAGLGGTWAMSEHASTGLQPGLAMPLDVVHLLCVAAWLGGLATLAAVLRWGPALPRSATHAFSRLAFVSVLLLVATGLYQSWRQVGSWSALTGTDYGRLLVVKVLLIAVLVGVAARSRRWTARLGESARPPSPAAGGGDDTGDGVEDGVEDRAGDGVEDRAGDGTANAAGSGAGDDVPPERARQLARQRAAVAAARRRRELDADAPRAALRRSVLAEAAVAVVLLAVTTALTGTQPARTEAAAAAEAAEAEAGPVRLSVPFDTGGPDGRGTATLELDPGRSGENTLDLRTDVAAEEVRVALTLPSRDIGPLTVTPERTDAAGRVWTATGVRLPLAGEWEVAVTVRTSDIDQVTEKKTLTIG
ncbi:MULTISPECIES: copper resistance CopC/CopD family protein [unclassified Streptomyces]|uniref:copper resistance CopC/CopD family protein n=1 Tax=unclassified Streptomyces TaxID=2593676 RepID=UPI0022B70601|nr:MULTISPECIES: copper resistance protein CopC [unclassified Streptomyces]MCZ7417600.1 copper resistance protein CopC [Streptomyces sp. WMMC897]MCZ7432590.1 copper resistance protein CopC [Streptomyces sp. WMMC1477]